VRFELVYWKVFQRAPPTDGDGHTGYFNMNDLDQHCMQSDGNFVRRRLANVQSKYQNVQIWEVDANEPIPEGLSAPRILYLDGVLQSSTDDERLYHEHLIHPAMLAHPSGARRVAILGGGEGASLREVLRHNTVEEAFMIELDDSVVEASKQYLKQLSNCSFDTPGYRSCFDDPRTRLVVEDCVGWFRKRFNGNACDSKASAATKFDLITMDLLDPEYKIESDFAKYLYSEAQIAELSCALNDDGVLVAQLGEAPVAGADPSGNKQFAFKVKLIETIAMHFADYGTFVYNVYVPSFRGSWTFVVGCKSAKCVRRWHSNAAAVELAKRQRLRHDAVNTLHFGGADQMAIQQTPQVWESVYCNHHTINGSKPASCAWAVAPTAEDGQSVPEEFLAIRHTAVTDPTRDASYNRSEVYVTRDVKKNEQLRLFDAATSLVLNRDDFEGLQEYAKMSNSPEYQNLVDWLDRYGYACDMIEGGQFYVALRSLHTFTNHGCNASELNIDGQLGDDDRITDDTLVGGGEWVKGRDGWDPVIMRRARQHCASARVSQFMPKGTELLEDYRSFDWNDRSMKRKETEVDVWCGESKPSNVDRRR
jgi:spermidine synthase